MKLRLTRYFKKITDDEEFLNDVLFSDEAHILLNGHVNSKNWMFERSENPYRVIGFTLH